MLKRTNKLFVGLLSAFFAIALLHGAAFADQSKLLRERFDKAKTDLIIGNTDLALKEFKTLESDIQSNKKEFDASKELYKDVLYNLGLSYQQKYYDESQKETLEGPSTDDLVQANNFFEKSDPELFEAIATMEGAEKKSSDVRAVNGIVGMVIKGKVKEWLQSQTNCKCSFSAKELNEAGSVFINLTEKTDIPHLKDLKTRDNKIQEIFSRIKGYLANLNATHPMKSLYEQKIKVSCKI